MTAATDLWASVVEHYQEDGLIDLTNINDRGATSVNTTAGENAAQAVLELWPSYAQVPYDEDSESHMEAARQGVIAMLQRRGSASASIATIQWDQVFSADGVIARIKNTQPRGRTGPTSSGEGVVQSSEARLGAVRPWSDPECIPLGIQPLRTRVTGA